MVPTTRTLSACMARSRCPKRSRQRSARSRGGLIQPAAVAQAGGEAHHLAQPVQDDELAVRVTRDDHVKTVGAQVDGGEDVGNDTAAAHL